MNGFAPRPTRRAARGAVPRMAEAAVPPGPSPRPRPASTGAMTEPREPIGGEQLWQTGTTPTPGFDEAALLRTLGGAGALTPEQLATMRRQLPSPMTPTAGGAHPMTRSSRMLERDQLRRLLLRPGGM
jgi:hypothetical protein